MVFSLLSSCYSHLYQNVFFPSAVEQFLTKDIGMKEFVLHICLVHFLNKVCS
jgi:hypothetical protein